MVPSPPKEDTMRYGFSFAENSRGQTDFLYFGLLDRAFNFDQHGLLRSVQDV